MNKKTLSRKMEIKKAFTTIDLFAGVGGMRLGFEQAGFKTLFANDFNQKCKNTYDLNFNEPKLYVEDLWKVNLKKIPSFDVLVGGFPCQAFSIAGNQKGLNDVRGNL